MRFFTVDLYDYFSIKKPEGAREDLSCYVRDNSVEVNPNRKNPAMLVIPGGGYGMVSTREGEPIALAFLNKGFNILSSKTLNIILIKAICPKIFKALGKEDRNEISKIFHNNGKNPIPISKKYSFEYIFLKFLYLLLSPPFYLKHYVEYPYTY